MKKTPTTLDFLFKKILLRKVFSLSILLVIFCVAANQASANTESTSQVPKRTLKGTVVSSSDGMGIPGANIVVKGTTSGTVTDPEGNFSLEVSNNDIIQVSFVGFTTQEIVVGDQTIINVILEEDVSKLEEVVVIGYGVQQKKLVTGATAQVKGDDLEKRSTLNALQAMQGKAAGINLVSTSGQPGESMKVVIRGVGTINNEGPLYIVDGVPTDDIDHLNNSDIESIDVLKDAASAAIYGSRAANGVILVTTRQGKANDSHLYFDTYYGLQNRAKKIDLLDAKQYAGIINEQHLNSQGSASTLPFDPNNLPAYTDAGAANTNWLDEMFVKNAITQNYSLGASGGTEQSIYSLSISYTGQEGIVGGKSESFYERYTARLNTEHKLYDGRVAIGEHLTYSYINKNGILVDNQYYNTLRGAFNTSPLLPVYDNYGDFFNTAADTSVKKQIDQFGNTYWHSGESNSYASMKINNQNTTDDQKLLGDMYANIEILKNLKFRTSFGVDYFVHNYREYLPKYQLSIYSERIYNQASQDLSHNLTWNWENFLTYNLNSGNNNLTCLVGTSARKAIGTNMYTANRDVAFDDLEHAYIDNTLNTDFGSVNIEGGPEDQIRIASYFGRVQYNFKETYLFNAALRADGSSKFAQGYRWGYFPSVSAGWVITNESFMSAFPIGFLKLRASWGQNGNQDIDEFQYLAPIQFTKAQYAFGNIEGQSVQGAFPNRLSNETIQWERSEQIDFGFDARILNNKLGVNFDWYNKTTKDWLITAPILATAGAKPPFINGGNVINKGVELMLSYAGKMGDFNYQVSANGAYNKNEVTDIPTNDSIIHGAANTLYNNSEEFYRAQTGYPIGYFWGRETDGIFQTTAEVQQYTNSQGEVIQPNAKPGDFRYVDQNDDGRINDDDKVYLGDPNPDLIFGLNLSANYKAFDINVSTNGVAGNQIVQSYRNHTDKYANYTTEILDRWNGQGTSNTIPRVTNGNINYLFSDVFVKNGSYLRIGNITFGVDLAKFVDVKNFSKCRFYASVENLYTFTSYSGMDPEVGFGFDEGSEDNFSYGVDLGFYPRPRTLLFGLNLNF